MLWLALKCFVQRVGASLVAVIRNLPAMQIQRRQWHPTPVLLPGKSHGQRSLVGCSPWGREELDMTEWLHFHFSLSCSEEGNGNPLQCSCLENPRDRGAWWAAVYGVAQSQTWLTRLGSSRASSTMLNGKDKKADMTILILDKIDIKTKFKKERSVLYNDDGINTRR